MDELEIVDNKFRELFPDMVSDKGAPLSPFIDVFEEGWNCGEICSKLDFARFDKSEKWIDQDGKELSDVVEWSSYDQVTDL